MGKTKDESNKPERLFFRIDRATDKKEKVIITGAHGVPGVEGYLPEVSQMRSVVKTQDECLAEAQKKAKDEGYAVVNIQQAFDEYFEFMAYN